MSGWCAWCGEDLPPRCRRFCKPRCGNDYWNDIYRERLLARFEADELLSDAQFSQIAARVAA